MIRLLALALTLTVPVTARAVEYDCRVTRKVNAETVYTEEHLQRGQFAVVIAESQDRSSLSRCSFEASANRVTCDRYEVDRVVFDQNVRIKKFYVFRSHFDVQLFANLSFVENNGRGNIAFGQCRVVSP
jgi:hypothetical protein